MGHRSYKSLVNIIIIVNLKFSLIFLFIFYNAIFSQLLDKNNFNVDLSNNPSIVRDKSSWDGNILESGDLFYDNGVYYWYYHANGPNSNYEYSIGVATSKNPTGPWVRKPKPILIPEKDYESQFVACASVMKYNENYYMYYTAESENEEMNLCIAISDDPEGPWVKQGSIANLVNYVGGVVELNGILYLFYSRPHEIQDDYGRIYLATTDNPRGPGSWKFHKEPVMVEGKKGSWDSGGFSEAEVSYYNKQFHIFYGGGNIKKNRMNVKESIGYAYSIDGYKFIKYKNNPIIDRKNFKNIGALAEVHHLIQFPKIFLVYTYRYDNGNFEEDLGMSIINIKN